MHWLIITTVAVGIGLVVWFGGRLSALIQLCRFGRAVAARDPEASFRFTRSGLIELWLVLEWAGSARRQITLTFIPKPLSADCFWTCRSLVELSTDIDKLSLYPPGWYYSGSGDERVRFEGETDRDHAPRLDLEAYRSASDDPVCIAALLGHPAMARALQHLPPGVKVEIRTPGGGGQTEIKIFDGHFPPSHDRLAAWLGALDRLGDALEQALQARPYR